MTIKLTIDVKEEVAFLSACQSLAIETLNRSEGYSTHYSTYIDWEIEYSTLKELFQLGGMTELYCQRLKA